MAALASDAPPVEIDLVSWSDSPVPLVDQAYYELFARKDVINKQQPLPAAPGKIPGPARGNIDYRDPPIESDDVARRAHVNQLAVEERERLDQMRKDNGEHLVTRPSERRASDAASAAQPRDTRPRTPTVQSNAPLLSASRAPEAKAWWTAPAAAHNSTPDHAPREQQRQQHHQQATLAPQAHSSPSGGWGFGRELDRYINKEVSRAATSDLIAPRSHTPNAAAVAQSRSLAGRPETRQDTLRGASYHAGELCNPVSQQRSFTSQPTARPVAPSQVAYHVPTRCPVGIPLAVAATTADFGARPLAPQVAHMASQGAYTAQRAGAASHQHRHQQQQQQLLRQHQHQQQQQQQQRQLAVQPRPDPYANDQRHEAFMRRREQEQQQQQWREGDGQFAPSRTRREYPGDYQSAHLQAHSRSRDPFEDGIPPVHHTDRHMPGNGEATEHERARRRHAGSTGVQQPRDDARYDGGRTPRWPQRREGDDRHDAEKGYEDDGDDDGGGGGGRRWPRRRTRRNERGRGRERDGRDEWNDQGDRWSDGGDHYDRDTNTSSDDDDNDDDYDDSGGNGYDDRNYAGDRDRQRQRRRRLSWRNERSHRDRVDDAHYQEAQRRKREEAREKEQLLYQLQMRAKMASYPATAREYTMKDTIDDIRFALVLQSETKTRMQAVNAMNQKIKNITAMATLPLKLFTPSFPVEAALKLWNDWQEQNAWAIEKLAIRSAGLHGSGDPKREMITGGVTAIVLALVASKFGERMSGMWGMLRDMLPENISNALDSAMTTVQTTRERLTRNPRADTAASTPTAPATPAPAPSQPQPGSQPTVFAPAVASVHLPPVGASVVLDPMASQVGTVATTSHVVPAQQPAPLVLNTAAGLSAPASSFVALAQPADRQTALPGEMLLASLAATTSAPGQTAPPQAAPAQVRTTASGRRRRVVPPPQHP